MLCWARFGNRHLDGTAHACTSLSMIGPCTLGWGSPPKFNDFRILYKPLKIKFWDLGSITIFFAVKFREDWSNRELCSSLVAHFQAFSLFFLIFWGVPPPKIMKNPFYCWVGVPPLKLRVKWPVRFDFGGGTPTQHLRISVFKSGGVPPPQHPMAKVGWS